MTGPETLPERPRARDDVVFRQLDEEWVVFDPRTQQLHAMNLTAALVWDHCSGERSLDDIVGALRGAFPDPPPLPTVRHDVEAVVRRFAREGLLA